MDLPPIDDQVALPQFLSRSMLALDSCFCLWGVQLNHVLEEPLFHAWTVGAQVYVPLLVLRICHSSSLHFANGIHGVDGLVSQKQLPLPVAELVKVELVLALEKLLVVHRLPIALVIVPLLVIGILPLVSVLQILQYLQSQPLLLDSDLLAILLFRIHIRFQLDLAVSSAGARCSLQLSFGICLQILAQLISCTHQLILISSKPPVVSP